MAAAQAYSLTRSVTRRDRIERADALLGLTAAALAVWTVVVVAGRSGAAPSLARPVHLLLYGLPAVSALAVLLWRPHSPDWARLALGWSVTVLGAVLGLKVVGSSLADAFAPLALVVATAIALRWPLPTLVVIFLLSGAYRSIEVFTPIQSGMLMNLLLAAAWSALVYSWFSGRRPLPTAISPVLLLLGLYLVATLLATVLADDLHRSLYAFRSSAWLMTLVFLIGLWASDERRRLVLQRGALVVGAIVGAYAMLRWAIGPAAKEAAQAREGARYVTNDIGDLKLFGSLPGPQALAVWSSAMFPFSLASTMSPIGTRWRFLAAAVTAMSGASLFGADARFGMVAGAVGGVAVLVLFACGRGFSGQRALTLAVVTVIATIGVGFFVTTKLSAQGSSGERFRNLVTDPIADNSVQQRFIKWDTLLAEVDDKPFGAGFGASGAAEKKYARFETAASFDPDSSYVKIAYDQGFLVLVLFGAALLSMVVALALAALETKDPVAAGRVLGSCGALAAFGVAMSGVNYVEGLTAVGPWVLVGIGCATFIRWRRPDRTALPASEAVEPHTA